MKQCKRKNNCFTDCMVLMSTSDAAGVRSLTRLQGQSWSDSTLSQCGGGRWPRLLRAPAESPRLRLLPGWERLAWSSPGKHTHSPGKHTHSPVKYTHIHQVNTHIHQINTHSSETKRFLALCLQQLLLGNTAVTHSLFPSVGICLCGC